MQFTALSCFFFFLIILKKNELLEKTFFHKFQLKCILYLLYSTHLHGPGSQVTRLHIVYILCGRFTVQHFNRSIQGIIFVNCMCFWLIVNVLPVNKVENKETGIFMQAWDWWGNPENIWSVFLFGELLFFLFKFM